MFEDIKRTFISAFGWIGTVLPEGLKLAVGVLAGAFLISLIPFYFFKFLGFILFLLALFCAFFFRNPKRNTVYNEDEIACPADGTVLSVKTEADPDVLVVRIFLSVFNVHVQRATIDGKVEEIIYTPGQFAFANNPSAGENERNLIKIAAKDGHFAYVEQITGAIARRIKCWVNTGDEVKKGQLVGLIRFGSQVAVYMPVDKVRVMVKEGQKVEGGLTVLALWKGGEKDGKKNTSKKNDKKN